MMLNFKLDDEHEAKYNDASKNYDFFYQNKLISNKIETLYKFYNTNINSIDSLLNSYFYLANPASFNDPFDSNKNLIVDFEKATNENKKNNFNDIGICSFCEDINHPIMWAHYTNNYRGFAVEFNTENFKLIIDKNQFKGEEIDKGIQISKVIYVNYIVPIQKAFGFYKRYLFATKGKFWQIEKEWRIIGELKTNNIGRKLYFSPDIVKNIYLGFNLCEEDETAVNLISTIAKIKYPNAEIFIVGPNPDNLKLAKQKLL